METIKEKCERMKAGLLPTTNNFVLAIGPGKEAHNTFNVDIDGIMRELHATVRLEGGKKVNLY